MFSRCAPMVKSRMISLAKFSSGLDTRPQHVQHRHHFWIPDKTASPPSSDCERIEAKFLYV
jgi:hypothetical protein